MKKIIKPFILMGLGGFLYVLIEILFRGYSHWTMFVVGGVCFLLIGEINECIPWEMEFWKQCLIGSVVITFAEFISGCIINLWIGWNVWDYSDLPLNIMGQVCLPFSVIWFFVSSLGIVVDDFLRYSLFGEEKPKYKIV